jgi:DNA-binding NarL/FixJ family response regulator
MFQWGASFVFVLSGKEIMPLIAFPSSPQPRDATQAVALKRALVVDDSTTILHAVCSLLEHHEIVEVAGRSESGPEAVTAVQSLKPDLLLMDGDMPSMGGLRASLVISQLHPEIKIVLMSMETGHRFVRACRDCGAHAVIYKPRFLKELSEFLNAEASPMVAPVSGVKQAGAGV